jgi:hypothetical protein
MRALAIGAALAVLTAGLVVVPALASDGYHACPGGTGGGGAYAVRVKRIACPYASRVLENGQNATRTRMRTGGFRCHHVVVTSSHWRWTCTRKGGREGLKYSTLG